MNTKCVELRYQKRAKLSQKAGVVSSFECIGFTGDDLEVEVS